jgi:hypothetical protein
LWTVQGRIPVLRLAIAEYADAVRSMIRLRPVMLPHEAVSPQKLFVSGPQSATVTDTQLELHLLTT